MYGELDLFTFFLKLFIYILFVFIGLCRVYNFYVLASVGFAYKISTTDLHKPLKDECTVRTSYIRTLRIVIQNLNYNCIQVYDGNAEGMFIIVNHQL